jgi:hypothetical protein
MSAADDNTGAAGDGVSGCSWNFIKSEKDWVKENSIIRTFSNSLAAPADSFSKDERFNNSRKVAAKYHLFIYHPPPFDA